MQKLLVILTFTLPFSSQADGTTSGMSLLTQCNSVLSINQTSSSVDMMNYSLCTSYIAGTIDGLETFHSILEYKDFAIKRPYCLPKNFTLMQGVMVVTESLKKNSKDLNLHKRLLVNRALMNAFPCPK